MRWARARVKSERQLLGHEFRGEAMPFMPSTHHVMTDSLDAHPLRIESASASTLDLGTGLIRVGDAVRGAMNGQQSGVGRDQIAVAVLPPRRKRHHRARRHRRRPGARRRGHPSNDPRPQCCPVGIGAACPRERCSASRSGSIRGLFHPRSRYCTCRTSTSGPRRRRNARATNAIRTFANCHRRDDCWLRTLPPGSTSTHPRGASHHGVVERAPATSARTWRESRLARSHAEKG